MGSNPTPSAKTIEIIEEFIIYSGYPQSDAQWIRAAPALDTINVIDVIIVIAVLVIFLIAAMFQKRKQRKGPP